MFLWVLLEHEARFVAANHCNGNCLCSPISLDIKTSIQHIIICLQCKIKYVIRIIHICIWEILLLRGLFIPKIMLYNTIIIECSVCSILNRVNVGRKLASFDPLATLWIHMKNISAWNRLKYLVPRPEHDGHFFLNPFYKRIFSVFCPPPTKLDGTLLKYLFYGLPKVPDYTTVH